MNTDNREELQRLIGEDYKLQWIVGQGGMSTVWLADDQANDREVAIKVLRPELTGHEEFLTRFRNEALAAEGIESDNVVATYDYREVDAGHGVTLCYIVMEYIRGESLADMIAREGRLEESLALDVLAQAANGLAVIHRMNLVHRDIKPGNLMITQNGRVKITDFGIAKAAAAVPLTKTGMVVGTAQYVSPEQAQGKPVTATSDVYSLAVVGYEMLAGRRPFSGDSSVSVALAHVNQTPPPLSTSVSAPTRELIGIGLRKDPNTRFADGAAFLHAIEEATAGQRPTAPKTTSIKRVPVEDTPSTGRLPAQQQPPQQQHPMTYHPQPSRSPQKKSSSAGPALALLVVLLLAGAGGLWAYTQGYLGNDEPDDPTTTTEPSVEETTTDETEEPVDTEEPTEEPAPKPKRDPETKDPDTPRRQTDAPTSRRPMPTGNQMPQVPTPPATENEPEPNPNPQPNPNPNPNTGIGSDLSLGHNGRVELHQGGA